MNSPESFVTPYPFDKLFRPDSNRDQDNVREAPGSFVAIPSGRPIGLTQLRSTVFEVLEGLPGANRTGELKRFFGPSGASE
jgi:hypothetical protein